MTDKISDAEALLSLEKESTAHRSKIGRLRSVFREIEELQVKGFSNQAIVDKLNEVGYGLTLKTFETMLYRIRKDAGSSKRASLAGVAAAPATSTTPPVPTVQKVKVEAGPTKAPADAKAILGDLAKKERSFSAIPDKTNLFQIDDEGK